MFFVLKFELILIIGSNNVLTEGARKAYRGREGLHGHLQVCMMFLLFIFLKKSASLLLLPFLARGYTMHFLMFSCRCSTLHVSAYMAIFRCVGFFFFYIPEGICFAVFFLPFLARGYTMHVSCLVVAALQYMFRPT
jgi:hypothetical protein